MSENFKDFNSLRSLIASHKSDISISKQHEKGKLTRNSLLLCFKISDLFAMTLKELGELSNHPDLSALDKMLINSIIMCISNPSDNTKLMDLLLTRFAGKVREEIEVNGITKDKPTVIQVVSSNNSNLPKRAPESNDVLEVDK